MFSFIRMILAYFRFNLKSQLEYRGAFISQAAAMFFNDCIWLAFWTMFFTRFPVVRGWTATDVITLWAVVAAGFGLAHAFCGNALTLPTMIARGQMDVWMLYPRVLLPHLLVGRMNASACGDAAFGYFAYFAFTRPDWQHAVVFVLMTLSIALLFIGFSVLTGSLGFFVGNAEVITEQWRYALIMFGTYPFSLFDGNVRIVLSTVVPAAFVSFYPVEALRHLSLIDAVCAFSGSVAVTAFGTTAFYYGLSRYESGNLMEMRG